MDKITIKRIETRNFKGIAILNYDFNDNSTTIYGPNGSGKSTIKNAWEWCLCQSVEDYIPMLNNREVPNLTTSVNVYIHFDNGIDYKLTRESIQNNGPRGRENKLVYKIDDIEIPKNVYTQKIANILGAGAFENLPLLTDKDYFNTDTTKWKWNDRRKLLLRLSDADEKCKSLLDNDKYDSIREYVLKGFETAEIQSSIAKEKKELNKAQQDNITRIETKAAEMNELLGIDFDAISKELSTVKGKLTKLIKESTSNKTKDLADKIYKLSQELDALKTKDTLALKELKYKKIDLFQELMELLSKIDKKPITCPNCKSEFVIDGDNTEDIEELKIIYADKEKEYHSIQDKIKSFETNPKINEIETEIESLKLNLEDANKKDATKSKDEEIKELSNKSFDLQMKLAKLDILEKGNLQMQVWKDDNKEIADKLIKIEEKEMALQDYVKEQSKIISDSVNEMFGDDISWSLFNENYNGSIEQDCVCLYKGKRYSSLSTGEKNKVNIEVTNTLQKLFNVSLPMFIDNCENMTLLVENVDSQLIWLVATKDEANIKATKITDLY